MMQFFQSIVHPTQFCFFEIAPEISHSFQLLENIWLGVLKTHFLRQFLHKNVTRSLTLKGSYRRTHGYLKNTFQSIQMKEFSFSLKNFNIKKKSNYGTEAVISFVEQLYQSVKYSWISLLSQNKIVASIAEDVRWNAVMAPLRAFCLQAASRLVPFASSGVDFVWPLVSSKTNVIPEKHRVHVESCPLILSVLLSW